ncbi:MAG: formylmethanofuran dehydrogenase [Methyloceanibacter sp.]|uniref:formylmethanofuran dehydrogenase n=1 Tax=Methyloceanibacter sp. TaxID=1965321 RepID=UPI003D9B6E56
MQASTAPKTGERNPCDRFKNVTCPFCGMLCDDLEIERNDRGLEVLKNGCGRAVAGFERQLPPAPPLVGGKEVLLSDAISEAAQIIRQADLPLYGGLATDVDGMRAAMSLADRTGGVVDHALSEAQYRNFQVLQSTGWTTSTLTETRNRADLIIVVGTDVHRLHPRFFERIVCPAESMFDVTPARRTVVFIGKDLDRSCASGKTIGDVINLPCDRVGEVLGVLRARLKGFRVADKALPGIELAEIDALAEHCRKANYGVVVWAPPSLDFPHAEIVVEQITGLVKDLNQSTRFAGLSLGGNEGAITAGAVCAWQSGYPLRTSYASGAPDYDPYRYHISRMLAAGEGDVLTWIASIGTELVPPPTDIPTIVLGTPGLKLPKAPDVFIPIGTPGVDHAGRLIRVDNVVSLPLQDLGRAELPRAADVLAAIEAAL